ncbi:AMP-binding protein [Micromonospora sp. CPCC 206061]|uniref:AMP-binding protein n=1 Tax=Micromonospora sp. CPCC 206061 TaxID=3122410 RepID=UPI002FF0A365
MNPSLLSWLDAPSPRRGIRFAGLDDSWDFWSYQRLADLTERFADGLAGAGVPPDAAVTVISHGGPRFVAALFGTMRAGATPSPLAPPMLFGDPDGYAEHVHAALTAVRPAAVLVDARLAATVAPIAASAGAPQVIEIESLLAAEATGAARDRPLAELALVQFTSGSSGRSRPVRVPHSALAANVAAIRAWLGMRGEYPTASWLPVHHDMGLTGCLITPVVDGSDIWLLSPEQFIQHPLRFLRCFGALGARHTAMPTFGLAHIVRRVRPEQLAGLDFSRWRAVIVGAERVDPVILDRFLNLLEPYGLRRRAALPAYGMAEATLAATGLPVPEEWRALRCEPASLTVGARIRVTGAADAQPVVGCGRPLDGVEVRVEDPDGQPLPEDTVGEIVVRGVSVAAGYAGPPAASGSLTTFTGDRLRSGDAGFLHGGQLFVLGRLGDSLKIRARTVFAEDLEAAMAGHGVPSHRFAAVLGVREGTSTAVAIVEHPRDGWLAAAAKVLRHRAPGAEVVVVDAPRGTILRTTSGKPKRRLLWQLFVAGRLAGNPVSSTGAGSLRRSE